MALDKSALAAALKTAFETGRDQANWTADDAARAMANAIDRYVRAAEVVSVATDVKDLGGVLIGRGAQTGTGALS